MKYDAERTYRSSLSRTDTGSGTVYQVLVWTFFKKTVLDGLELKKQSPRLIANAGDQVPPGAVEERIEIIPYRRTRKLNHKIAGENNAWRKNTLFVKD